MQLKFPLSILPVLFLAFLVLNGCQTQPGNQNEAPKKSTEESLNSSSVDLSNPLGKQSKNQKEVQQAIEQLFEVCKSGDFRPAAELMVYRGPDKSREWKSKYNYATSDEKNMVDKNCSRILAMVSNLDHYEFSNFIQDNESEGEWNVWEMNFHYQDGTVKKNSLAFLHIFNDYLLGDID